MEVIKGKVENILKNFQKIKAYVNTIQVRIDMLTDLLSLDNLSEYYQKDKGFFRKPMINRPTETAAIAYDDEQKNEYDKIARKEIKKEIEKLKAEKVTKQQIIKLVEIAFEALTSVQEYIIKSFYFHKMTLDNIVKNLQCHNKFKHHKVWCIATVCNYKKVALQIIDSIICQYIYDDFIICIS